MKILVCLSFVPDTTTKIVIGDDGKSINNAGVKYILNPYDEYAIEEGLRLRETHQGEVIAITVGGDNAKDGLRTALAMGVDRAIFVKDEDRGDSFSVAENIASFASEFTPDVIVLGRQSIDYDSWQLASMIGELLDIPSVSVVSSWSVSGDEITIERDVEGGKETIKTSFPLVISAQKGLNDPRYPKLPDIMKAKSKPIDERPSVSGQPRVVTNSMSIPESSRKNLILGDSFEDISRLVSLLHEEAKVI